MKNSAGILMQTVVTAALLSVAACTVATPMRQVDDDRWQVSINRDGPALRLIVRDRKSGIVVAENPNFLPRSVDQTGGEWALSSFTLVAGEFSVAIRYHPQPGTGNVQDKRFSFDLRLPGFPLVAFETAVTRAEQNDRQRFDLLKGESSRCVTTTVSMSKACEAQIEALDTAALVPLAVIGPAESYTPPIALLIVN